MDAIPPCSYLGCAALRNALPEKMSTFWPCIIALLSCPYLDKLPPRVHARSIRCPHLGNCGRSPSSNSSKPLTSPAPGAGVPSFRFPILLVPYIDFLDFSPSTLALVARGRRYLSVAICSLKLLPSLLLSQAVLEFLRSWSRCSMSLHYLSRKHSPLRSAPFRRRASRLAVLSQYPNLECTRWTQSCSKLHPGLQAANQQAEFPHHYHDRHHVGDDKNVAGRR